MPHRQIAPHRQFAPHGQIAPHTQHASLLSRPPDLERLVASRARERGWRVIETLSLEAGELRQLVLVPECPRPVVVCVRTGVDSAAATAREESARRTARSEHVVGAVSGLGGGPGTGPRGSHAEFLFLEHAAGGTLADLLARRCLVRTDEAATILVGVASGLGALHEAGWATGGLTAGGVAFRRDGCPAIDGLRDATAIGDGVAAGVGGGESGGAGDADARAFLAVAAQLCAVVPAPGGWRLLAAVEAVLGSAATALGAASGRWNRGAIATGAGSGVWERVIERVLAVVEPGMIRLTDESLELRAVPEGAVPERADTDGLRIGVTPIEAQQGDAGESGARAAPRRTQADLLAVGLLGAARRAGGEGASGDFAPRAAAASSSGPAEVLARSPGAAGSSPAAIANVLLDGNPVAHLAGRARAWLAVRKKLVVIAVAPVVAVGATLLLIPGPADAGGIGGAGDDGRGADSASASSAKGGNGSAASGDPSTPSSTPPASASPSASPSSGPGQRPASAVPGEPVAAATALLLARHACFAARVREVSCLDDIVQEGSPLADSDRAAVGGDASADEYDYAGAAVELVQRWGEAALVSVAPDRVRTRKSEPASLLMVRSEAGWRLREVFP